MITVRRRSVLALIVLMIGMAAELPAVAAESQDLIIRNVYIIGPGGKDDDALANLIIRNGKLDLVSTDEIHGGADNVQIFDAEEGHLLGNLAVGETPEFLILNKNPVGDISVLADTKPFVVFAVDDGQIVRNELQQIEDATGTEAAKPSVPRWLSYQPPPFAIPSSHEAANKWNSWRSKYVNGLFISALALDRQWLSQDDNSISQFGDLSDEHERGTIRGWRFGLAGTLNFETPWVYNIAWAWQPFDRGFDEDESDELTFFDYSVDIPAGKNVTVTVGKQKEPINMDRSMTMVQLASQERYAAADAMFPTRNFGVVVNGTAANQRVSWAGGLFNDWLIEGENLDESATQVVGRMTWLPLLSEDESNVLHLGLGIRYTDAKQGLAYGVRPEVGNAPRFVDTGFFEANSSTLYNWEVGYRHGPYWLMAEYSDNHIDAPNVDDPRFTGHHVSGTWSISGEMRPYRNPSGVFGGLPVAQGVYQGGRGALELGLRYSFLDLTDGAIEGGEMDVATVQLNWWLTEWLALSANYKRSWTDRRNIDGQLVEGQFDAFIGRVILVLQ